MNIVSNIRNRVVYPVLANMLERNEKNLSNAKLATEYVIKPTSQINITTINATIGACLQQYCVNHPEQCNPPKNDPKLSGFSEPWVTISMSVGNIVRPILLFVNIPLTMLKTLPDYSHVCNTIRGVINPDIAGIGV